MNGKRVLVVEDNESYRETLVTFLRLEGHTAVAVHDCDMALAILENGEKFDHIVSDFKMPPGINELEFLQRVRADKRMESVPFILMSSEFDTSELERVCHELDAVFIRKSFDLHESIAKVLGSWQG